MRFNYDDTYFVAKKRITKRDDFMGKFLYNECFPKIQTIDVDIFISFRISK